MKKLEFNQKIEISGGDGRSCMILGGIVFVAACSGLWPAALTISAGSTMYGCFS